MKGDLEKFLYAGVFEGFPSYRYFPVDKVSHDINGDGEHNGAVILS